MSAETDKLVRDGIKAYRAGRKTEAHMLLEQATERDPENEQAWMWLSAVVDSEEDQRICLENVLFLNPNNENAKRGLKILDQKSGSTGPLASDQEDEVFANSSFTESAPPAPKSTGALPPTATSSASSGYQPEEPEPEIYDDWVAGLNLGGQTEKTETYEEEQFLDDIDFTDVFSGSYTENDDDDFDAGNSRLDSLMADDDLLSGPFNADVFTADPFSTDEYDAVPPRQQSAPKPVVNDDDFDPFDDDFLTDPDILTANAPAKSSTLDTGKERRSPSEGKRSSSNAFVNDFNSNVEELDPGEYFRAIPDEIQPTRLPGVNESYSVTLKFGLVLLLLLNIGAAGLLAMNFS